MADRNYIEGRKPDREIPANKVGHLQQPTEEERNALARGEEAGGRTSPFWVKCWSCHKYLTRPLSPPNQQAYTCPNCGAVNML